MMTGSAPSQAEGTTVVGVATGRPDGGVAIVRLSGPSAFAIAERVTGRLGPARELGLRSLKLASGNERALVVSMPGPGSYTGEDVVELHVHAGALNVREVLETLMREGAVAAEAGEFTRRAFENGRVGLDQAEGIAAVIGARTEGALAQARRLVAGELGREVDGLRDGVEALRVEVEAHLDFPEEVADEDRGRWEREADRLRRRAAQWLEGFEAGRRGREQARIVFAGPPNAGKSSLFNALLGRARALVAETPGTTRDFVEGELEIDGFACVLVDTAGLRAEAEGVEGAGVELTHEQLSGADVVVWVEGADAEPDPLGPPRRVGEAALIRVESKRDVAMRRESWIGASSRSGEVEGVRRSLADWCGRGAEQAWIGLARHRDRVADAEAALARALALVEARSPALELLAFELGIAQGRLGEITGRQTLGAMGADVLDAIFSRFCIGK